MKQTYTVYTLDVWGNQDEGYDINDFFTYDKALPAESLDDFRAFCKEHLIGEPSQYALRDEHNGFLEILHIETQKPILHFQLNFVE